METLSFFGLICLYSKVTVAGSISVCAVTSLQRTAKENRKQ